VTATETRQTYAQWLRQKMAERDLGVRGFARKIDSANPDQARRALRRHLNGMIPIARTRQMYARVLGTGDDLGPDSEDVEDD
jgi:hypothetical protein